MGEVSTRVTGIRGDHRALRVAVSPVTAELPRGRGAHAGPRLIVTYETIRQWSTKFGLVYAAGLRRQHPRQRAPTDARADRPRLTGGPVRSSGFRGPATTASRAEPREPFSGRTWEPRRPRSALVNERKVTRSSSAISAGQLLSLASSVSNRPIGLRHAIRADQCPTKVKSMV